MAAKILFAWPLDAREIRRNPVQRIKLPKLKKPYVRRPKVEEIQLLLEAVAARWDPTAFPPCRFRRAEDRHFLRVRDRAIRELLALAELLGAQNGRVTALFCLAMGRASSGQPSTVQK